MFRQTAAIESIMDSWLEHAAPAAHPERTGGPAYGPMAALAMLRLGKRTEEVEGQIRSALDCQATDPDDVRYGCLKDSPDAEKVRDPNFIGFACCSLVPIIKEYPDALSDDLTAAIEAVFRHSLAGHTRRQSYNYSYTNSFLTGCGPLLIIAEEFGSDAQLRHVRADWNEFYRLTTTRGVQERNSDCYISLSMIGLSLVATYSKLPDCVAQAKEVLAAFATEIRFHGNRFPIPARRTYNNVQGTARKQSPIDWYLGDCPEDTEALAPWMGSLNSREEDDDWFHHMGAWIAVADHSFRNLCDPAAFAPGGAPRTITGRYIDQIPFYAYYHPAYSIGAFGESPAGVAIFQHKSDLPVAFSGDEENLGFFGVYAIEADGTVTRHPGGSADTEIKRFGPDFPASRPETRFACHQERNVLLTVIEIEQMRGELQELGLSLRVPDWTGTLIDATGTTIDGDEATLPGDWFFVKLTGALAAIRPLEVYDGPTTIDPGDRPTLYCRLDPETGLTVHLPILRATDGGVCTVRGSQSGGFITMMLAVPDDDEALATIIERVKAIEVTEDLYLDGFLIRDGFAEGERRIAVKTAAWELSLGFDMKLNRITHRRFNGVEFVCPSVLSAIQCGLPELQP